MTNMNIDKMKLWTDKFTLNTSMIYQIHLDELDFEGDNFKEFFISQMLVLHVQYNVKLKISV